MNPFGNPYGPEKRHSLRFHVACLAEFSWRGNDGKFRRGRGVSYDIGSRGCRIKTNSLPPIGSRVSMTLTFRDSVIHNANLQLRINGGIIRLEPRIVGEEPSMFALIYYNHDLTALGAAEDVAAVAKAVGQ